jgi:hypothetical protein
MLNRRRSRPKFTRLRALFAGVALLGWAIPAVAFIAYVFCVDGFIATDRFLGLSIALSSAVAAVLTAGLLPVLWRDGKAILATGGKAGLIKVVLVAVVCPFLFFFPLQFSLAQILPHALHLAADGQPATLVELVTHASYGSRGCRRPAKLVGDRWLMHRQVCGLSADDNHALEQGGAIELQGVVSPYGFQVQRYRVKSVGG